MWATVRERGYSKAENGLSLQESVGNRKEKVGYSRRTWVLVRREWATAGKRRYSKGESEWATAAEECRLSKEGSGYRKGKGVWATSRSERSLAVRVAVAGVAAVGGHGLVLSALLVAEVPHEARAVQVTVSTRVERHRPVSVLATW